MRHAIKRAMAAALLASTLMAGLAAASGVRLPVRRPTCTAMSASAASCAVKHLVEATPISGPA